MAEPGWYQAPGDPAGTHRYWDGSTWVGDPRPSTSAEQIIYYEAAPEKPVDISDVATRVTLSSTEPQRSYAQSPYSVAKGSVNLARRPPMPESLKNLAMAVSILKAIPLILLAFGFAQLIGGAALEGLFNENYRPPLLDLDASRGAGLALVAVLFFVGSSLVFIQGRSVVRDDVSSLFSVALVMLFVDVLNIVDQLVDAVRGRGWGPSFAVTLVLVAQALVTLWAGKHTRKKYS